MKFKRYIPHFFLFALTTWYGYLGWTETFYRMGIFLLPLILLTAGVISGAAVLFKKQWRTNWFRIFSWISIAFLAGIIIQHKIDRYKPTYAIYIPEDFQGMVYLLPGKNINDELLIDENGIGYYAPGREVDVKVYHGDHNSTNALNQYGDRTLIFPLADSIHYESIFITCFGVEMGKDYGGSIWNQPHAKCMDEQQYLRYVAAGIIDETLVKKVVYPRRE